MLNGPLHKLLASLVSVPLSIPDVCTRFPSQPSTPAHNVLRGSCMTSGATACALSINGSDIYSNRKRQTSVQITLETQYHADGTRCSPTPRPCNLNTSTVIHDSNNPMILSSCLGRDIASAVQAHIDYDCAVIQIFALSMCCVATHR